jgi:hypothetical protein
MDATFAPGLPGRWLNGWLAALGITVLVPTVRLAWTIGPEPVALFTAETDLSDAIAAALPDTEALSRLAIARSHPEGDGEFPRAVSLDLFRERAVYARASHDLTLEATVTDLAEADGGKLAHAPLDPPMPRGITLHERLATVRGALGPDPSDRIRRSLAGAGIREQGNGLGFDHRRFPAGVQPEANVAVDPVVETLAFYGLLPLSVRGDGHHARQRGWSAPPSHRGAFTWPVWSPPLDRWAIDALLDLTWSGVDQPTLRAWGVTGLYASVSKQAKSQNDVGRAYASERRW